MKKERCFSDVLYNLLDIVPTRILYKHQCYPLLVTETSFLSLCAKISQRLWHIENNIKEIPKCKLCLSHVNWIDGKYRTYCSTKCLSNDPEIREKTRQTNLKNHGVEYPIQAQKIKEKTKQTCLKNHGVEHNWQKGSESRAKGKRTMIERHGAEHALQNKEIRQKSKQTCLKNHGVEFPLQSEIIREKTKLTNLKTSGVENPKQKHIPQYCLKKLNDKDWLYNQHIVQKKGVHQISDELNVDSGTVIRGLRKHGIVIRESSNVSCIAIQWLESVMEKTHIHIQHGQNEGEFRHPIVGKVDGYCKETNTIYEFHGDFWHGNPQKYNSNEIHPILNITMGELYQSTLERENLIKSLGYNLVIMWASTWKSTVLP